MKLDVFVDEITAFMEGRDGGWSGSKGGIFEGNEMGSGREGFEVIDYGRRERRAKEGDCVMGLLGRSFREMQQERRSRLCNPCGDIMSGLEDENAAAGSKGDNKKENVRCEVLFGWEELRFPEELHEDWCEEVVEDGFWSLRECGEGRKAEVEAADGGSRGQERLSVVTPFHGGEWFGG